MSDVIDNPFVENIGHEQLAAYVKASATSWQRRFKSDAELSRKHPWMLGRGHWSHTVTREQYKRFVKEADPLLVYPDEIFEGWVYDPLLDTPYGVPQISGGLKGARIDKDGQKRVFDAFVAEQKAEGPYG